MSEYFRGNDDDELIERLRRTLQTEAAALRPRPERQSTGGHQAPGRILPLVRRWPYALAAVAAAAAIAIAAIEIPGSGKPIRVETPATSPGTTLRSPTPPTTVVTRTGAPPPPPSLPPVTLPPVPVPAGFQPQSVTFDSFEHGWVLGSLRCASGTCLSMAQTHDGGRTWAQTAAPSANFTSDGGAASVRFADGLDGWVYVNNPAGGSQLWATHDGGTTWTPVRLAALVAGDQIEALEVSSGTARMAVLGSTSPNVQLLSTPVGTDDWTVSSVSVPIGAGPVPSTQLVLQRDNGWALENDRTVVGAADLGSSDQWQGWTPPCANANGPAALAASDPTHLAAICQEGEWGTPGQPGATAGSEWLFASGDAGSSFEAVGALPSTYKVGSVITTSGPDTVVAGADIAQPGQAGPGALVATFDGGHTWEIVYEANAVSSWTDVGFTNQMQGVAVGVGQSGTFLLMTHDGGHTWAQVEFSARP